MKARYLLLALLGLWSAPALAEEQTLLGDLKDIEHGGFGGPVFKFTQIDGEFGVLTGGRGGWIINHRFVLGGGGYGLSNNIEARGIPPVPGVPGGRDLEMGYGGGMIEYIIASDALVHFSVELLVGAGGMTTLEQEEDDAFFVAEPSVNALVNVTKFCRIGAGVSYRHVRGVHFGDLEDGDLSGAAAVLTIKFGSF